MDKSVKMRAQKLVMLYYTLKNGVALLKPHLNVTIFRLLKFVHITYTDVAFTVKPHQCP